MAKTLNQLINEATQISRQLTTGDIPIRLLGADEVTLELMGEDGHYWVCIKPMRKPVSPQEFKSIINNKQD